MVQRHDASQNHFDFRLQVGDMMKSWVLPKGPSADPKDKRLAIEVEDHSLDYSYFEGVIPQGQYGSGVVLIWDEGCYQRLDTSGDKLSTGYITFCLQGQRLRGRWTLVKWREKGGDWLLIKGDDEWANRESDLTEIYQSSVITGRTVADIKQEEEKEGDSFVGPSST